MKTTWVMLGLAAFLAAGCGSESDGTSPVQTKAAENVQGVVRESGSAVEQSVQPSVAAVQTEKPAGWYMRTVISAYLPDGRKIEHRTAGVFGELDDSSDGLDRHDIEAYGEAVFQVRFVNENLAYKTEYFSDYRAFEENVSTQKWTFQVRNQTGYDLSNATFRIAVEGPYDVYRKSDGTFEEELSDRDLRQRLTLWDMDRGTHYTSEEFQTMHFDMGGKHTRTFQWVLGEQTQTPPPFPAPLRAAARKKSEEFHTAEQKEGSKFGLPPQ